MRTITGHWVIGQLSSASQNPASQINPCLDKPGVVGYGPRIPVNFLMPTNGQFNTQLLDRLRAISMAKGKLFKPRVIFGKYALQVKGITIQKFTDSQGTGPMPFLQGGARNVVLEDLMNAVYRGIAGWAADKPDVRAIDCGWASLNYSEQYFGPGVQSAFGASASTNANYLIASEKRIIDMALAAANGVLPVGFGLSGHGPIDKVSTDIAAYLESKPYGYVLMQANGWAPEGEWGGALESKLDAGVWPKHVVRGLQDISSPYARSAQDNIKLFDRVESVPGGIHYTESYFYEFTTGAQQSSAGLTEFFHQLATVKTLAVEDEDDPDAELEALREQLADLNEAKDQIVEELQDAQGELVAAQAAVVTATQQVATSTNDLAQVNQQIADVEAQIAALGG